MKVKDPALSFDAPSRICPDIASQADLSTQIRQINKPLVPKTRLLSTLDDILNIQRAFWRSPACFSI
jgi:hypothetical protein